MLNETVFTIFEATCAAIQIDFFSRKNLPISARQCQTILLIIITSLQQHDMMSPNLACLQSKP